MLSFPPFSCNPMICSGWIVLCRVTTRTSSFNISFKVTHHHALPINKQCCIKKHYFCVITTSLPRNLALKTFGKLLIVFSAKVNLLNLLYLKVIICEKPLFAKNLYQNSDLKHSGILYLLYFLELIWNCIIFLQLPRWLKRS